MPHKMVNGTRIEVEEVIETPVVPTILRQIYILEEQITPRRIREAIKGPVGKAWLDNLDDQIATLRAQL